MKVTPETTTEVCQAVLNVELEPGEVEKGMEAAYRRLAPKLKIPGFRPGKAPRSVLERHVGSAALLEEALEKMIPDAYEEAVKEQGLEAVARPQLELLGTEPVVFKAKVPLKPIVDLDDYRSKLRAQPEPSDVSDEEISRAISQVQNQHATLIPVDRAAQFGDVLTIDIQGATQGESFLDHKGTLCELIKESPAPMPGFSEQLVGASKDDTREFTLAFPEDHENKQIAGKTYTFKVKVNEVKEKKLPELDDEFAKTLGSDNYAAWQISFVDALKKRAEDKSHRDFETRVVEELVKLSGVKYPDALLEHEIDHALEDEARNFKEGRRGIEDYLKSVGKTMEQHREELRDGAMQRLVRSLVLERASEDLKVEVTSEEIDAEIGRLVNEDAERADDMRKFWNLPQARHSIEHYLINKKTLAGLSDIARGEVQNVEEEKREDATA